MDGSGSKDSRDGAGAVGEIDAALAAVRCGLVTLARTPWWQVDEGRLADVVAAAHTFENIAAAVGVGALTEAVTRGVPGQVGATSAAAWLRGLVPVTPSVAVARARLADQLPRESLTATREAFAAGVISAAHAGVLARTMVAIDAVPDIVDPVTAAEVQELLLVAAEQVDPAQLGRLAARTRYALDPGAGERLAKDEDAQEQAREATLVQDGTGMWHLRAVLPPAAGAAVRAALDPLAAPEPATDGTPDPRPARVRFADALYRLARLALAAWPGSPAMLPTQGGSPTRLSVVADLDTVLARAGAAGVAPGRVHTGQPGGWMLSPLSVQTMGCDAEIVPILTDHSGRPLDVGRTVYPFPPRIRKAIEIRDGHCTFPSCDAPPPWCDAHHLVSYARDGGPTAEANGALLCGPHHRFVHARGWTGRITDGQVAWTPAHGGEVPANAYYQRFELLLRDLAHRWLARNPEHRHHLVGSASRRE